MIKLAKNNPLIHRVKRHSEMSVLFRSAEPQPSRPLPPTAYASLTPNNPLVQAIPQTRSAPNIPAEQTNPSAFILGIEQTKLPTAFTAPQLANSPASINRPTPPVISNTGSPAIPVQPQLYSPAVVPPIPSPAPTQTDDKEWSRLQAIFNAHKTQEEQDLGEAEPALLYETEAPQTQPTPIQQRRTEDQPSAILPRPDEFEQPAEGPTIPPTSQPGPDTPDQPPQESSPEEFEAVQPANRVLQLRPSDTQSVPEPLPNAVQAPEGHNIQTTSPSQPAEPLPPPASTSQAEEPMTVEQPESFPTIASPEPGPSPTLQRFPSSIPVTPPTASPSAPPAVTDNPDFHRNTVQPEQENTQPYPLEAIWPVQRLAPAAAPQPQSAPPEPAAPTLRPFEGSQQIEQVLQRVAASQPTDSKVEVITPIRPRPVILDRRPIEQPIRPPETQAEEPSPLQLSPEPGVEPRVPASTPQSPQPEYIETAIGKLPADLWQLINQPLPQQPQGSTDRGQEETVSNHAPIQRQPETSPRQLMQEAPAETPAPTLPAGPPAGSTFAPAEVIQRSPDSAASQNSGSAVPEGGGSSSTPPTDGAQAAKPDKDELARLVYQEIKHRLSIEWERFRNNF
jgi:hypothetical protein